MRDLSLRRFTTLFSILAAIYSSVAMADDHKLAIDKAKGHDLSVIVLGSGGPMPTATGRASAGYMILTDGEPRLLMDLGGGTYARIAESGAYINNIEAILITHMHLDHMADLSAVIKGMFFHARTLHDPRTDAIEIYGPADNQANAKTAQFPSIEQYTDALFNPVTGIDRYLIGMSGAINGGQFSYDAHNEHHYMGPPVDTRTTIISDADGLVVESLGVMHGPVPALAYRISYKGHSIVYTGDTTSRTPASNPFNPVNGTMIDAHLVDFASGADLLIYDTAITDTNPNVYPADPAATPPALNDLFFFNLHTTPATMGQVAAGAGAKTLLLSHITPISEPALPEVEDSIRAQGFRGRIKIAKDLKVFNFGKDEDD